MNNPSRMLAKRGHTRLSQPVRLHLYALLAVAAFPSARAASDGPYIGVEGGFNFQSNQKVPQGGTELGAINFDNGYIGGLNFGYAFDSGWRPEIAFDYRHNGLSGASIGGTGANAAGFESADSVMANLWYDLRTSGGVFKRAHPYIGFGVGGARAEFRHITGAGFGPDSAYDTVIAYQGGAGVNVDVSHHLSLSADYRFFQTATGGYNLGVGTGGVDARYRTNTAMLGMKYLFGIPEPPPPPPPPTPPPVPLTVYVPPPPPPPIRTVCRAPAGFKVDENCNLVQQTLVVRAVDFEYNSAQLTQPAMQSLDEVAAALLQQPGLVIEIDGYTDNIGGVNYNLRLSQARASSVMNYLVSRGVNGGTLSARGFGMDRPIADNRTPQGRAMNRRVEFVIAGTPAGVSIQNQGATAASTAAAEHGERPAPVLRERQVWHERRHHHLLHHRHHNRTQAQAPAVAAPMPYAEPTLQQGPGLIPPYPPYPNR